MRDNNPPIRDFWCDPRQHRCDVLVRQAMKPVSLDSLAAYFLRQGNQVSDRRLSSMKARIEACDLRHVGQTLRNCFDGTDVVGLVQRGERRQGAEFSQHLWCYDSRARVKRPTMHNAMPNTHHLRATIHRFQPSSQMIECVAAIADLVGSTIHKDLAFSILRVDPRRTPDSIYLATRFQTPIPFGSCEDTELQAG